MKILMVLTSHDVLGNTGRKTGFWLDGRLVTGQNPASSTIAAQNVMNLLAAKKAA